jgi:hypothetical protein
MQRVLHVRWNTDPKKKDTTGHLPLTIIHTQWPHWNLECSCVNKRLMRDVCVCVCVCVCVYLIDVSLELLLVLKL